MDVQIRGRNVVVTDRFTDFVNTKTAKIEKLLPKLQKLEIRVSKTSDKSPVHGDRVEVTAIGSGPVIRAEASGSDKFTAFDTAYARLLERIRRYKDKKVTLHRRHSESLSALSAADFAKLDIQPADAALLQGGSTPDGFGEEPADTGASPVMIRHKSFPAERLTSDAAVDQMELLGHDFFLFIDAETDQASVVYRRKGWNYGVITLED